MVVGLRVCFLRVSWNLRPEYVDKYQKKRKYIRTEKILTKYYSENSNHVYDLSIEAMALETISCNKWSIKYLNL